MTAAPAPTSPRHSSGSTRIAEMRWIDAVAIEQQKCSRPG